MSESVRVQVTFLLELKRIDDQAYRIQVGLKQIPEEIAKIAADEKQHEAIFTAARTAVSEAEKKLRATEQELKVKEDEIFKAEGKMMEVKTNVELLAVTKENEARKAAKGILEERALTLMTSLEAQRQVLAALEKEHESEKTRLVTARKTLEEQKTKLEGEVAKVNQTRDTHALQLEPKIMALYKRAVNEGRRSAIAYAQNGQCGSCNMQVRPQVYNEILANIAIHLCGHCRSLLIPNLVGPNPTYGDGGNPSALSSR